MDSKILGVKSNDPSKHLKVHIESQAEIHDTNKNGKPVEVLLKRGYNTVLDGNTGELYDPKFPG